MNLFEPPVLSRPRIWVAYGAAIVVDAVQVLLGPAGWTFADEILDVAAMALTSWALGFHPLLLPTFILEVVPVVDFLPTWTGCVALVVSIRKRQQSGPPPPPSSGTIIDV